MVEVSVGSLSLALERAVSLLQTSPARAAEQAQAILKVVPREARAALVLGMARRRLGDAAGALEVLEPLARGQPRSAQTHHELGLAQASLGQANPALASLRRAVSLKRELPAAWRAIGDLLGARGDVPGAERAYAEHIRASVTDPALMAAADALCDDSPVIAERLLRGRLRTQPADVAAMRMMAEALTRLGRHGEAEVLLMRCLDLAPGFGGARYNLAIVLYRQQKAVEAASHMERLLAEDPDEVSYRNLMAACLGLLGDHDRAIDIYRGVLADHPHQPRIWLSYGHALRTAGRRDEAVAAYGRSLEMAPGLGETYWSLANLKTQPFNPDQEDAMARQLARSDLATEDRLHFHYALGKALEDRRDYEAAFGHYAQGARLRRAEVLYDADLGHEQMTRAKTLFTQAFFAARAGQGSLRPDPIFIVGLPRSGSTLVEQILASHSAVEGTMELPDITTLARRVGRPGPAGKGPSGNGGSEEGPHYPEAIGDLDETALRTLGEAYIDRTRVHRKLGRPLFIDKMPNNFHHIGLIHLILPNARIIDARRHAMASCFSAFKQHFARGHAFSYDLTDLGRYYSDYVEIMAHYDEVLPGRVHRVIYERMVEDTEGEVRRLLDYCGLPFEAGCLRFHENTRAVRTASSEQVRRPIFREGLNQWRNFEPWLGDLKAALGPDLSY